MTYFSWAWHESKSCDSDPHLWAILTWETIQFMAHMETERKFKRQQWTRKCILRHKNRQLIKLHVLIGKYILFSIIFDIFDLSKVNWEREVYRKYTFLRTSSWCWVASSFVGSTCWLSHTFKMLQQITCFSLSHFLFVKSVRGNSLTLYSLCYSLSIHWQQVRGTQVSKDKTMSSCRSFSMSILTHIACLCLLVLILISP